MELCDCFWTTTLKSMLLYKSIGALSIIAKTTKVHAALLTNSMACTVSHKTYIKIILLTL